MVNQSRASHREADERLKAFMNSASDGFLILDGDLRIIEANQNWLDRAQVTEKIYGTPIHELFPVLMENGRYEAYLKVIKSGEAIEFDEVVAPSGSGLVYNIKAFKVGDGLGLISRNITERVHTEEHIVFLNELLKAIRDVNQLIVKEKDPSRLITESCRILTSTQGFTTAYIALVDGNRVLNKYGKGDKELVQEVDNILSTGEIPTEYMEWTTEEIKILQYSTGEINSSLLISPLKYHSLNYGVILCQAPTELFDNQVIELFKEVTGDLSYALYALSMEEKFNALFGVSLELTNASTSREIYSAAFKALTDAFHYRRCAILLVEGDTVKDEYLSGFGRRKKYTLDIDGPGLVTRAARTGKTVYVPDVRNAADYIEAISGINIHSELCVPVKVDGKVRAVINVERQEVDTFNPQDIKLLETLSNYMEAVLSKNKTMESLKRSEKNFLKLLHSMPDPVIVVDSESILFVNNTLTELLGYEPNELIGEPNTSIFPEEDRERLQSNSVKRLRGDPIETKYELELLSKNLEIIIAEVNLNRIEFYGKTAILGVFRDIRERKKMEEHIEYLYQVLLAIRNVNQLIVTEKNRAKLLQKVCDLMVETKGYNYSRIMILDNGEISDVYDTINNLSKFDTIHEIDAYPCIEKLSRSHVTVFTDPASSCDGCPLYSGALGHATLGMAIAHNDHIYGYFTAAVPSDMTGDEELSLFKEVVGDIGYALYALDLEKARAKAVASLAESQRRYRDLLDSGMDGVTVNILGELVYVNSRFQEMIGYTEDELLGSSILDLHAPEYREMIKERTKLRHNGADVPNYYQVELVRKDGSRLPVSYSVSRIIYDDQPASLTYIHDMSEIKQITDALAKSEEEYRVLVESAQDIIIKHDMAGNITFVNNRCIELTGLSREDLFSSNILDFIHPDDIEKIDSRGDTRRSGFTDTLTYRVKVNLQGDSIPFEFISTPIVKEGEIEEILIIARDITQQVRAEKRLTQYRQRLEELHNYSLRLSEIDSVDELVGQTINALQGMLDFEFCDISQPIGDIVRIIKSSRPGKIEEMSFDGPGIVIRAIKTGETQYVPDVRDDPDYLAGGKVDESGEPYVILSELAVPVKVGDEVQLVLNMERSKVDAFTFEDRNLAELLAAHTASAYEIIQERKLRTQYTTRLESLYLITETLPTCKSIEEIAEKIETTVRDIIGFDLGSFALVKGNLLHHEYVWGVELSEDVILPLNGTGVTVRVVQTGEPQFIRDTTIEDDYFSPDEAGLTRSELCVPVKVAEEVVAVINIESRTVDAFSLQDTTLLSILAEHVGSTIHNLRLLENEREFSKRLEALSTAAASLNAAENIEELASETLAIIDEIMDVPYTSFSIVKDNTLEAIKSKGAQLIDLDLPLDGPGITVRAVREKKTSLLNDTRKDPDFVQGSTDSLSELAVPLIVDGESKGVINMESLDLGYFDSTHQSLTETLAANVASNMQRIQREEATREAERRAIREQERAEQAIELDEMKTGFIRTATHEIRTPLTSIKGYTQLAQIKIDQLETPDLDKYFDAILRNTERLESLSADLLDIQRIESGQVELNKVPTHIQDLLRDLELEIKPILDSRNQKLCTIGGDYLLNIDRIRMMQVLVNLVMNASKFSPEGSQIKITIEKESDMARISISDEGVGIKEEDIPKLFKPFPGIKVKGVKDSTGLGLSISKGLVELHGGKIWVESEGPGKGSKFTFTCPCILGEGDE